MNVKFVNRPQHLQVCSLKTDRKTVRIVAEINVEKLEPPLRSTFETPSASAVVSAH